MRHNGERSPEEIEAEIERTRADMDATLSAIEGRLTPGQLVDQGLDYLRHSGANEFVSNLGESVKHHPLPVALVGLGVAWLMMAERRPPAVQGPDWRERAGEAMHRVSGATDSMGERMGSAARSAEDAMHRASATAGSATRKLGETAHATRETLSHAAATARESAARWGESSRHQLERARGGYEWMLREQPLALGAVGLAVGAVLAAALPRTRREDELMGEARDRLTERAKEVGREQAHKAQRVAEVAGEAAAEEAARQGLTAPPAQEGQAGQSAATEAARQGRTMQDADPFACPATDPTPPTPRTGR